MELKKEVVKTDGWMSTLTGLGSTIKDKMTSFYAQWSRPNEIDLEERYAADDVSGRFVDEIPNEGTRAWIELIKATPEQTKAVTELMDKLCSTAKFRKAWKHARLYGGSGILVNTNAGVMDLAKPLNLKAEGGEITSLIVLSSYELRVDSNKITSDVANENFGLPEYYMLQGRVGGTAVNTRIHHSRIIRLDGQELPDMKFRENGYWHDSVLTKSEEAIRNYNISHHSIAQAVVDFSVPVVKIKGLADLVGAGKTNTILSRVNIMNMCKSVSRMILIDETETLEHLTRTITGMPECVGKSEDRLVMSTKMPRSKILGESPPGLNSNGESEETQWYDLVSAERERVIEKPFNKFFMLMLEHLKLPSTVSYKFKSMWQESAKEKAETYKTTAEADEIYMTSGVISPSTVQESRFGGDEFGTEIKLGPDDAAVKGLGDVTDDPNANDPNLQPPPKKPKV